ncbi:hypothetical protein ADK86_07300 [Streptomyces sp. NRRL F-5755]|nr:hypothetical protein ADK86_07300 [Streptomyces sp. NRRL F-5755]
MVDGFETQHGVPPGVNEVRLADDDDIEAVGALTATGLAPADLLTFYGCIGAIELGDVGNGYFVNSAADVLAYFREYGPVSVHEGQEPSGLVIAADGGGLLFVVESDGVVHRTRTASLDEPEFDKAADDLRHFLELLAQSVTRFTDTGEPGYL